MARHDAGNRSPDRRSVDDQTHTHAHTPAPPASRRVRRLLTWLLAPFLLATLAGLVLLYPTEGLPTSVNFSGTPIDGDVTAAAEGSCRQPGDVTVGEPSGPRCLTVEIRLSEGANAGNTISKIVPVQPDAPRFAPGDPVVLAFNGGDPAQAESYILVDFQRGIPLLLMAGLFALAVLVLGRWQGARALVALALSFVVLALFILPAILAGEDPLVVGIVGAGTIMFGALYLTHGMSVRTSVAVLGTMVSLALIGVISMLFSGLTRLTGLGAETSTLVTSLGHGIDARGLLLAGVVIGALGVLDDVTVTQASAVWELHGANPALGRRDLYAAGLRIGRDHVSSAVNTLVLAYAGAALPLLMYSAISGVGLGRIIGSQDIAQEIVRTLAGSMGIIAAVPVTTVLAALIVSREHKMTPATNG
ncbi:MAG: YibE/F family protein [Pseudonocardiaceae bacterium]